MFCGLGIWCVWGFCYCYCLFVRVCVCVCVCVWYHLSVNRHKRKHWLIDWNMMCVCWAVGGGGVGMWTLLPLCACVLGGWGVGCEHCCLCVLGGWGVRVNTVASVCWVGGGWGWTLLPLCVGRVGGGMWTLLPLCVGRVGGGGEHCCLCVLGGWGVGVNTVASVCMCTCVLGEWVGGGIWMIVPLCVCVCWVVRGTWLVLMYADC